MIQYISKSQINTSLIDRESFFKANNFPAHEPHVLLQTCDRIEIYWGRGEVPAHVAQHLFRVVSGLESSLIGETAIQGQVKLAYQAATQKYKLSASLHKLFQNALRVGKRVRTQSGISEGAMSHSQAVIECLLHEKVNLSHALISMMGVNKLNDDIIRFLKSKGAMSIFLSTRYFEKAQQKATQFNCKAFRFDEMKSVLAFSNVLITATSAPHVLVKPEHISPQQPILIIDLAFPRDVDPAVGLLPNVTLYNLDDIRHIVQKNLHARSQQSLLAQQIINTEVSTFCHRHNHHQPKTIPALTTQQC